MSHTVPNLRDVRCHHLQLAENSPEQCSRFAGVLSHRGHLRYRASIRVPFYIVPLRCPSSSHRKKASAWRKVGDSCVAPACRLLQASDVLSTPGAVIADAQHLAVIGGRLAALRPRKDMVAVHLVEFEVFATLGADAVLALVCLALLIVVEGVRSPSTRSSRVRTNS